MTHTFRAVGFAALLALLFCTLMPVQGQEADTPPAPLTATEKFEFADLRSKVLELTLNETSLIQGAENAMREARDKIIKERDERLQTVRSDRDVTMSKINEKLAARSKPGWKLNYNTFTFEKEEPAPAQSFSAPVVKPGAVGTHTLTRTPAPTK